jgi:hypothetical protein
MAGNANIGVMINLYASEKPHETDDFLDSISDAGFLANE